MLFRDFILGPLKYGNCSILSLVCLKLWQDLHKTDSANDTNPLQVLMGYIGIMEKKTEATIVYI